MPAIRSGKATQSDTNELNTIVLIKKIVELNSDILSEIIKKILFF